MEDHERTFGGGGYGLYPDNGGRYSGVCTRPSHGTVHLTVHLKCV